MNHLTKKIIAVTCVLTVLFLFAFLLRTYRLSDVPKSLHNDEIANTYATRFVLENKKDVWGNKFPLLYLDKFGDYPPVLPMYVSALGTYIFGTNEFGSRIGIALIGASFVIPLFLLVNLLMGDLIIATVITALACILPWHFILSRANAEGIVALTAYAWGLFFALKSIHYKIRESKHFVYSIVGVLLLLLTYFLYPSYRIFIPTTFIGLLIFSFLEKKKIHVIFLLSLFISVVLTLGIAQTNWGQGRFKQTSIFNEVSGVQILIDGLNFNEPNIITARIFNNKPLAFTLKFISQYFDYFSPNYLFTDGGYSKAYSVPYAGLIFISLLFIVLFTELFIADKKNDTKRNIKLFLLYLLLTAPIAAAVTVVDTPNNHRSLPMILPILLLLSFPLTKILRLNNKVVYTCCIGLLLFESIFFFHNYFQHANLIESPYRNDGNKEVVQYILKNREKYDKVLVTNQESWLPANYLFFSNNYSSKFIGKFKTDFRIDTIDNVYFLNQKCVDLMAIKNLILNPNEKILVVDPEGCPVSEKIFKEIYTIKRANFTTAFIIYQPIAKPPFPSLTLPN